VTLSPDQLAGHLKRGLAPCYLVSGDEPLLVGEALDAIRKACREQGVTERETFVAERGFNWQHLLGAAGNLSLFGDRRLLEVRLPTGKPGDAGSKALIQLAQDSAADTCLVVVTPALDKRALGSRWASALTRSGSHINIRKVDVSAMPAWIRKRLKRHDLAIENDALEMLVARVEGNLLAAQQEIDKLELLDTTGSLSAEDVSRAVADGARFDVFRLADAAVGQNAARVARMLAGLKREGVAVQLVCWALSREILSLSALRADIERGARVSEAMAKARIWRSRTGIVERGLRAHDGAGITALLEKAARCDLVAKGALAGEPWGEATELAMALAGESLARGVAA
jgi:DNA polymerase-3 subunit delta